MGETHGASQVRVNVAPAGGCSVMSKEAATDASVVGTSVEFSGGVTAITAGVRGAMATAPRMESLPLHATSKVSSQAQVAPRRNPEV
jgi:hypothetical protein